MQLNDRTFWVLIVNLNPGGPNSGSATQYFTGQFDGSIFTPADTKTRWLDYGPDEYAGITWGNTGNRHVFLGWMSNWLYGPQVPTVKWRSAMTIPRELKLQNVAGDILLASEPVNELKTLEQKIKADTAGLSGGRVIRLSNSRFVLKFKASAAKDYAVTLSNKRGEQLVFGFDKVQNHYYIDRSRSGDTGFNPSFANMAYAPRLATATSADVELVVDDASIEVFADKGLTTMTAIFFPTEPFSDLQIAADPKSLNRITLKGLRSIW
jgi:fructan beta-fructosidase